MSVKTEKQVNVQESLLQSLKKEVTKHYLQQQAIQNNSVYQNVKDQYKGIYVGM